MKWVLVPRSWNALKAFFDNYVPPELVAGGKKREQNKKKGIHLIAGATHPTFCTICETSAIIIQQYHTLKEKKESSELNLESLEMTAEFADVKKRFHLYERHMKQLAGAREYVARLKNKVRENPERALLFRDFVSWYAGSGAKVMDLIFVLYRSNASRLVQTDIHNIYWGPDGKQDAYFYRDCLLHLLERTKLLTCIQKMYMGGDHGPCFSSKEAFYFDSTIHGLTGKMTHRHSPLALEHAFLAS